MNRDMEINRWLVQRAKAAGFSAGDVDGVMGENWRRFLERALKPAW